MIYSLSTFGITRAFKTAAAEIERLAMVAYVMLGVVAVLAFLCISGAVVTATRRAQGQTRE